MTSPAPTRLLKPEVLQGLANLELIARSAIEGLLVGMHRSVHHGFSQEFAEYRAYQDGDDPRFIDWNVYARTERMYLKQFWGETNTHLTLLVDASASMGFASGKVSKYEYGTWLAASLAHLARRQQDAIGLMLFNDGVISFRPPSGRQDMLAYVLHNLEQTTPGKGTGFARPIRDCCQFIQRPGIVAIISDFLDDPERLLAELRPLHARKQDVILFQILDPQELGFALDQPTRFEDMESGTAIDVDPDFIAKQYPAAIKAHIERIADVAKSTLTDHILLTTDQPLDYALREYLLHRGKRV